MEGPPLLQIHTQRSIARVTVITPTRLCHRHLVRQRRTMKLCKM